MDEIRKADKREPTEENGSAEQNKDINKEKTWLETPEKYTYWKRTFCAKTKNSAQNVNSLCALRELVA